MTTTDRCWYVAYGSNLCRDRFLCYLYGGRPSGGRRAYAGARDPSPPSDDRPAWLDGGIYFAGESAVWTGGVAVLDPEVAATTPARAYLITVQQFDDVVAQERRYDTVLSCLDRAGLDGIPAYTFTVCDPHEAVPRVAPSPAYLRTMVQGLVEAHGWTEQEATEYLRTLPGVGL